MRMPRPATFDPDVVVDRAMLAFWTTGYAGTSVADLVESTELLRGSIYHAFGDKRSLYIQSLHRYGRLALQQFKTNWNEAESLIGNVRSMLMVIVDLPFADKQRGSLICNCIAEVVPHDPEIAQIVEGILSESKALIQSELERAKSTGELDAHVNTTALARYLASSVQGLCMTAKAGAPRDELLDIVEVTLAALR
jgi:TetR/AcrR family transcriptional repressor of nem operon